MAYKDRYKRVKQRIHILFGYIAFLTVLSFSVFLMPFAIKVADKSMILTYTSGILFWIGLIGTLAVAVYITVLRRQNRGFVKANPKKQLGLIHFFQNTPASICDILMFVSLFGFIFTDVWTRTTILPFIFLSLLIFSFGMHCMLNGSNYIYINYGKGE